ncbi:hypothetical protein WICANDRAFT_68753 [Wickerhamomyces anomalus NRRL Y-366-8]|uniref:BHLH domain-containing protein n=1 Tax=Wickerhamomyces anomalus (strain ATCC 58044 / CBS 1984 / NCYC 433 / NRRL Y-366-8) TaxID=683960 RepID=A0A1E3P4I9_WICAA|nr:uncharacterized protein WICANDRAFT_68753 [Wickerhamomyces anomalus NRRL Y-366-8]ODQ60228.1 hypothetical protein WICANDRAFT_68753 [Wickerhamomyces anomalus NRRL Y-366-8]
MTDVFYSFDDTDALLASLSSSSANTLSPSDNSEFSGSAKSSSYGLSPEEVIYSDNWNNNFNGADADTLNDDFFGKDLINFDANELSNNDQQVDNNNTTKVKLENNYASTFVSPESMAEGDFNTVNNKLQPQVLKREESLDSDSLSENESPDFTSSSTIKKTSSTANKVTKPKKTKATHNVIEKKYRTNINTKITALRDSVPALRMAAGDANTTINDLDGLSPAAKVNKAIVLTKATEYIKHLERKNSLLMRENQQMKHYLGSLPAQSQQQHHIPQQQFHPQPYNMPPNPQYQTSPLQNNAQPSPDSFQPANYNGQQVPIANVQQPYQMGLPGKVLMGGMATMVGQNLFNGGGDYGDFRGLSAFPIMGNPLFIKFFHMIQFLFVSLSVVYLISPALFQKSQAPKDKKTKIATVEWYELAKELVFIQIGSKLKREATQGEVDLLINQALLSSEKHSFFSLTHLLLRLFTYQPSFEVSFGKLVVAKLLLSYTDIATFINLNGIISTSLSEIANQKVSDSNCRYFFKEFKTISAQNSEAFKRLLNIVIGLPIGTNCERGVEDKGYFLILRDERVLFDYKTLLISLRANEIFREVLLEYINLTFNSEEIAKLDNEELREGKKELWNKLNLAENLAPKRSIVDIRIKLFKSILNEKYVDSVLQLVNEESKAVIATKKLNGEVVEEKLSSEEETSKPPSPILKDENEDEVYDSDESFGDSETEEEDEVEIAQPAPNPEVVESTPSSSINPKFQNLLSQDLFNALVSSSILKFAHADQHEQVSKLLKYIKFSKDELTLLSFISLYKLVQKFPKNWLEGKEGEVIENLVGHLRVWVGDSSNVNFNDLKEVGLHLKREISDNLVEVGKSFSELD